MRTCQLNQMTKGWFVGNFSPVGLRTEACEVACKHYSAGDYEPRHLHRVATEVTLIVSGRASMNGQIFEAGDIVILDPNDATDFKALEQTVTIAVKVPSVADDKYPA